MIKGRLARGLMAAASALAPAEKESWSRAMRAEFDVLEDGRLRWAFGGFCAAVGWRVRSEWIYLVAFFVLTPVAVAAAEAGLIFLPDAGRHFYLLTCVILVLTALPAGALGAYRPSRLWAAAIGVPMITALPGQIWLSLQSPRLHLWDWWGPKATYMSSPPFVGLVAAVGACYFAAALGARLSRRAR